MEGTTSNPITSKRVARKASSLLRSKRTSKKVKSVAAAALGGARGRKRGGKGKK